METIRILKDVGIYKAGDLVEIESSYVSGLVKAGQAERIIKTVKIIKKRINK